LYSLEFGLVRGGVTGRILLLDWAVKSLVLVFGGRVAVIVEGESSAFRNILAVEARH